MEKIGVPLLPKRFTGRLNYCTRLSETLLNLQVKNNQVQELLFNSSNDIEIKIFIVAKESKLRKQRCGVDCKERARSRPCYTTLRHALPANSSIRPIFHIKSHFYQRRLDVVLTAAKPKCNHSGPLIHPIPCTYSQTFQTSFEFRKPASCFILFCKRFLQNVHHVLFEFVRILRISRIHRSDSVVQGKTLLSSRRMLEVVRNTVKCHRVFLTNELAFFAKSLSNKTDSCHFAVIPNS